MKIVSVMRVESKLTRFRRIYFYGSSSLFVFRNPTPELLRLSGYKIDVCHELRFDDTSAFDFNLR